MALKKPLCRQRRASWPGKPQTDSLFVRLIWRPQLITAGCERRHGGPDHSESQTGRFRGPGNAGNIDRGVHSSQQNHHPSPGGHVVPETLLNVFALACSCFLDFKASLKHLRNSHGCLFFVAFPSNFFFSGSKPNRGNLLPLEVPEKNILAKWPQ